MAVKNDKTGFGGTDWANNKPFDAAGDLVDTQDAIIDRLPPIGAVQPWLKSFTNTPALPDNWVECNGQTISDADSPYDGQAIPDLNGSSGDQRFLRGATTSGGTGGSDTHTLTVSELPNTAVIKTGSSAPYLAGDESPEFAEVGTDVGGGGSHENRPPYYEVVWIMRIK